MRTKLGSQKLLLFIVLALVVCVAITLLFSRKEGHKDFSAHINLPVDATGRHLHTTSTVTNDKSRTSANVVVSNNVDMERPPNVAIADWSQIVGYFNWRRANNAPIDFYGKVVDQYAKAVPQARIRLRVSAYSESLRVYMEKGEHGGDGLESRTHNVVSDVNGFFSLARERGEVLYIEDIAKDGFEVSGRETKSFAYGTHYGGRYVPDSNSPAIFKLWKKTGATEPLIKNEISFKTKMDSSQYSVDIIKGKVYGGARQNSDLIVHMWVENTTNSRPSWSASFTAPSGGLIETDDRYLYLAPTEGYKTKLDWQFEGSNRVSWTSHVRTKIYLQSRSGHVFAALEVELYKYPFGEGGVILDPNLINPHGSRNLEYDKTKEITGRNLAELIKQMDSQDKAAQPSNTK